MYFEKLKEAKIAVAGLGGLGSNIAVMLARAGVGKLLLVDYDQVEESNLNRQAYTRRHLGMKKSEALESIIKDINPDIDIVSCSLKVTDANLMLLFGEYELVCEAFDCPEAKAMLVGGLLSKGSGNLKILSGSGMAGVGSANEIRTERKMDRLYVSGDYVSDVDEIKILSSARVMIVAAHQAQTAIRFALGMEDA